MKTLPEGHTIEFFLDEGESLVNVTRSLKDEGYSVLNVDSEGMYFRVLVEKSTADNIQPVGA